MTICPTNHSFRPILRRELSRAPASARGWRRVFFIVDIHAPQRMTDPFLTHPQPSCTLGLTGIGIHPHIPCQGRAIRSIRVAGLLRPGCGSIFLSHRTTLATPTPKYIEDARKAVEENYSGCYKSLANYAEELTEDTSQIPENFAYYIDYERMGRDMELNGDVYTVETAYDEVHVFWSH